MYKMIHGLVDIKTSAFLNFSNETRPGAAIHFLNLTERKTCSNTIFLKNRYGLE